MKSGLQCYQDTKLFSLSVILRRNLNGKPMHIEGNSVDATTISIARRPTVDRWPIDRDHRPSVQKILLIHRLNFTAVLWTLDRLYVVPRPTYLAATRSTYRPMYLSICRSLISRHSTDTTLVSLTLDQLSVVGWYIYIDYFMVGERVRFLFTSCEE